MMEWGYCLPDLPIDRFKSRPNMFSDYSATSANVISANFAFLLSVAITDICFFFA